MKLPFVRPLDFRIVHLKQLIRISVFCGLALVPLPTSPFHDHIVGELSVGTHHADIRSNSSIDFNHNHRLTGAEGQASGSSPSYTLEDHSHQVGSLLANPNHLTARHPQIWRVAPGKFAKLKPIWSIDRPPKFVPIT